MRYPHVRFSLRLMILSAIVGVASFPIEVPALGGFCGGATPCECGDQLIASRTLVRGVDPITTTICPGHGLVGLRGSLDLGGNTLRGTGAGIGVEVAVAFGITVTNGEISNFAVGVDGDDVNLSHFTDLHLTGNVRVGIAIGDSNHNVIGRNIVTMMECGAAGISVAGGTNEIRQNRVEFNRFGGPEPAGIRVRNHWPNPGGNTVSRNVVRQNTSCGATAVPGFWISDSSSDVAIERAPIQLNRSEDNDGDGFIIESFDAEVSVGRNVAVRNGAYGFNIATPNSRFDHNRADDNALDGVSFNGAGNVLERNALARNGRHGAMVSGDGNTVARNVITSNLGSGLVIQGASAVVDRNRTIDNAEVGLEVQGVGHTVRSNNASFNAGTGVQMVGTTDSRFDRNRAEKNGGFGIIDDSTGDGTAGSANTYTLNLCGSANTAGPSSPLGVCR